MTIRDLRLILIAALFFNLTTVTGQSHQNLDSLQWELEISKQVDAATLGELNHNQTELKEAHLHLINHYRDRSFKYRDTYSFDSALYYLNIGKTIHEKVERFDRENKELWMRYQKTSARLFDEIAHCYYMKGHFDIAVRNRKKSFDGILD